MLPCNFGGARYWQPSARWSSNHRLGHFLSDVQRSTFSFLNIFDIYDLIRANMYIIETFMSQGIWSLKLLWTSQKYNAPSRDVIINNIVSECGRIMLGEHYLATFRINWKLILRYVCSMRKMENDCFPRYILFNFSPNQRQPEFVVSSRGRAITSRYCAELSERTRRSALCLKGTCGDAVEL